MGYPGHQETLDPKGRGRVALEKAELRCAELADERGGDLRPNEAHPIPSELRCAELADERGGPRGPIRLAG
ncbi:hypothetical protein H920_02487 [Fukomys damarensis]|uniref:Uncharacterized protein n=1 Tax=Fukomys damarensis TaxID=885580 RepID=A0A091E086_FUKDA|nr:hypothetical protein H920_02487 [Fukomys damarensis]